MSYLQITNKGEINPYAISLMGASTKRNDDSQIGFFGTGNKYALALFLRSGLEVSIHSGETPINIDTHEIELGESSFSVIRVNGRDTSITTDMGPTWAMWQAVREVYSNALDAGDASIRVVDRPSGREGYTHYHVKMCDELESIMSSFDSYFSTARIAAETSAHGSIYSVGTGTIYRHGIRCNEEGMSSVFDYEVGNVKLTETRLAEYQWQVGTRIWGSILSSDDPFVISRAFAASNNNDLIEGIMANAWGVDFPTSVSDGVKLWLSENMVSDNSMSNMMDDTEKVQATFISSKLMMCLISVVGRKNMVLPRKATFAGSVTYELVNLGRRDIDLLRESLAVISSSGISIDYPVVIARFGNKEVMGYADPEGQRIVLSETIFSMGAVIVVATILEEWIHLKHGVKDETRMMQDAIFNEFSTVLVRQAGSE